MTDAAEVLAQLDNAAHQFVFPDLGHGYFYAVDARLHLYADHDRWALVVETVGYNPRGFNLYDVVHTFGNCLTHGDPGFENEDFHPRIDNLDEVQSDEDGETYAGNVFPVVRGRTIELPEAVAGEHLATTFRRLVPEHRDLLLADEAELRRRVPADLPLLLTLDEWRQPDPVLTLPSGSEAYCQLADVAATLDVGRYAPTLPPNTHWSHWPESGSM